MVWTPARGHIILHVVGGAIENDCTCECFQNNMTSYCWHCEWFFKNLCVIRFGVNCYVILWLMILNSDFWPDWSTKNMWSGKTHQLLVWKLQATCTLETTIRKKDLCIELKTVMFSPLGRPCECFLLHTNALFRCSSQS